MRVCGDGYRIRCPVPIQHHQVYFANLCKQAENLSGYFILRRATQKAGECLPQEGGQYLSYPHGNSNGR